MVVDREGDQTQHELAALVRRACTPSAPPSVAALPNGSPASATPGARNKRTGSPKSSGSMDPCGLADAPGPANPSRVWPTDLATPSRVSLASDVNASGAEGDQDATQSGQP